MKKIKAIVFDLDGTLSYRAVSAYEKYRSDIKEVFPSLDETSIEFESIVQNCILWDQYGNIRKSFVYEQLAQMYNLEDSVIKKLSDKWVDDFYRFSVLREGVLETLEELSKNYKIGCITNGDSLGQHRKLDFCDLNKYFDSVLVSGDLGYHKPDPRIFLESCKKLQVDPGEMVYVGDTFYADVYGATLAGCIPVWIWNDEERQCKAKVHRIRQFRDIVSKIKEIEAE